MQRGGKKGNIVRKSERKYRRGEGRREKGEGRREKGNTIGKERCMELNEGGS